MTTLIRLIIADDHALFRGGLKSLLRRQRDMKVVGEVDSADALMEALADTACDVLLLDLQMERWALDDIRQLATRTKVLVLTASETWKMPSPRCAWEHVPSCRSGLPFRR